MLHTYQLWFTVWEKRGNRSFPGTRVIKSALPWTDDNRSAIEKAGKAELDYMFENWSDMAIEPRCSCCSA